LYYAAETQHLGPTYSGDAPSEAAPLEQEAQGPQEGREHGPEGAQDVVDSTPEGKQPSHGDGNGQCCQDLHKIDSKWLWVCLLLMQPSIMGHNHNPFLHK